MRPYHGDVCDNYESLPLHTYTRAYVHVFVSVCVCACLCAQVETAKSTLTIFVASLTML